MDFLCFSLFLDFLKIYQKHGSKNWVATTRIFSTKKQLTKPLVTIENEVMWIIQEGKQEDYEFIIIMQIDIDPTSPISLTIWSCP